MIKLNENKRIFWNIIATYGRSLYALAIGLITARWIFSTLGEVDYGLLGVIGGLTGFVSMFNSILAGAVSRYYAFAIGERKKAEDASVALGNCQGWFSVAVMIHTIIPLALMLIGYPIGQWAVRNFLTIPTERIEVCIWVFRVSCLTCLIGMMSVPYKAMYTAQQEIAELTIYGFATSTINVFYLFYMIKHPGDWLLPIAIWNALLIILPELIIIIRALKKYDECRFSIKYCKDISRVKQIFAFAGSRFVVSITYMLSNQGVMVIVNKFLGPIKNATMNIGNTVSQHSQTLATAMCNAFAPAITTAAGAGDFNQMRTLAFRMCKFATVAILIFALPLFLEVDKVMVLWLKKPPAQSGLICICMIIVLLVEKISNGHWLAIAAVGKVAVYGWYETIVWILVLPCVYLFIKLGWGLLGVGLALVTTRILGAIVKLIFAHRIVGMSIRYWVTKIFIPIFISSGLSLLFGWIIEYNATFFSFEKINIFLQIVIITIIVEIVFLPLVWFFICDKSEQEYISTLVLKITNKIRYGNPSIN